MRLDDLYSYKSVEELNEAPYGMLDKMKDKIKSKTPFADKEGAKGRQQSGEKANMLFKKFKNFAGQSGYKGSNTVPSKLVANFLSQNKLPNDSIENEADMSPSEVQQAIMKSVQNKVSGMGGSTNNEPQVNPQHTETPTASEPQVNPTPKSEPMVDPVHNNAPAASPSSSGASTKLGLSNQERKLALAQLKKL